jgi:nitroreductase
MPQFDSQALVRQLEWRYAVKKFDPTKKIPADVWAALERTLVLAPSSYGAQPWKFFVIEDPALREKLRPASWNQAQIVEASHLVVFAIKKRYDAADLDRYMARTAEVRGMEVASLEGFRKMVASHVSAPGFDVDAWSAKQVYLALGGFLTAAAVLGVDACPMEGFNPAEYDRILELDKLGYSATVLATAGYRSADDKYADLPKVRFPLDEVIERR